MKFYGIYNSYCVGGREVAQAQSNALGMVEEATFGARGLVFNRMIWGSSSEVTAPRVRPHMPLPGTLDQASDGDRGPPRQPPLPVLASASGSGRGCSRTHTKTDILLQ